jgi:hypothetical protein
MPTCREPLESETRISIPFVFRKVIEAMWPNRDNSPATKYSPATPHKMVERFDGIGLEDYSTLLDVDRAIFGTTVFISGVWAGSEGKTA